MLNINRGLALIHRQRIRPRWVQRPERRNLHRD